MICHRHPLRPDRPHRPCHCTLGCAPHWPAQPEQAAGETEFGTFNLRFLCRRARRSTGLSRDTAQVDKYINDPLCGF